MTHFPCPKSSLRLRAWLALLLILMLAVPAEARARRRTRPRAKTQSEEQAEPASKKTTASKKTAKRSAVQKPAESPLETWEAAVNRAEDAGREQWSVRVEDLATTRVIYDFHPKQRLTPASNRKVITMALAMETLGLDYTFTTEFGMTSTRTPGNSHYHGNLVLRSAGDPSLGFPFDHEPQTNPRELFASWARELRNRGVTYVHGDLVIDASAFGVDQNHFPEHWRSNYRNQAYAPIPSAIAMCQNLLRVKVKPGSESGRLGRLSFFPGDDGLSIVNETRTASSSCISATFNDDSGDLVVSGRVDEDGGDEVMVPMARPLNYAATLMQGVLEDAGVRLTGTVRIELFKNDNDGSSTLRETVGKHFSPPLSRLLTIMMRNSNNFLAEELWRASAARALGRADLARTRIWEQTWYYRKRLGGIEPGWDGSGLSHENQFASADLAAIARTLYSSPYREFVLDALPESGRNGTLRNRNFDRGAGRVIAKTGTLNDASSLTGYICDKSGTPRYVFSVIGNGRGESSSHLAGRINNLVEALIQRVDAEI